MARMRCNTRLSQSRPPCTQADRKSTRLNSSHLVISYAVFCLKKKKQYQFPMTPDQESFYAAAFKQSLRLEISVPAGHSTHHGWLRLHPSDLRFTQLPTVIIV